MLIQRLEEDDATWRGEMGAQALGEWVLLRLCLLSKHKTLELLELRSCSRVAKEEEPDVDSGDEDPCGSFGRNQPLNRRYQRLTPGPLSKQILERQKHMTLAATPLLP